MKFPIQVKMTLDSSQTQFNLTSATAIKTIINADEYEGDYTVIPLAHNPVILETEGKVCTDNITVTKIPTYETHNDYGLTFYIREGTNGN